MEIVSIWIRIVAIESYRGSRFVLHNPSDFVLCDAPPIRSRQNVQPYSFWVRPEKALIVN